MPGGAGPGAVAAINGERITGGGGGRGGGGDAQFANQNPGCGGSAGSGGRGGATGGGTGNRAQSAGAGGGGAFILAASNGIFFSGMGVLDDGEGAVYGTFTNSGSFPDGLPAFLL